MTKMQEARKAKGLTLMQVAVLAGTYPGTVSRIERGVMGVKVDLAKRLGEVLDMDPRDIVFMERAESAA